ncbi:MAG: hypothetical protein ACK5QC_00645 [Bacteroidota bacterium]
MSRKKIVFIICVFISISCLYKAQTLTVVYSSGIKSASTVTLVAFKSIALATKVNPDSVFGLDLVSQQLKDFPKEILKFRNLRYLNIDSYNWSSVLDSLTSEERKLYQELKSKTCDKCGVMKFYKSSIIKSIPKGISNLKKLEYVNFGEGVRLLNIKQFKKIYSYLPQTLIFPTKYDLD